MHCQIFDTALRHWRATMTRRNLWSLVLLALLAVCGQAQAQTACPQGQTRVTSSVLLSTGCFDDALIPILNDCKKAGWRGEDAEGVFLSLGELACEIPSSEAGGSSAQSCYIVSAIGSTPLCATMYGDPPVFPKAAEYPHVRPGSGRTFTANCDNSPAGTTVPGGYPPNHNLNGETECSCDLDSHIGTWPNCVATPDLTRAQREGIGTCASRWSVSTATASIKCEIPLTSGGTNYDGCFFGEGPPRCADVFGEEYAFPDETLPVQERYVFNCGEGMIPAGANLNGATECVRQPYLRLRLRLFLEGPLR